MAVETNLQSRNDFTAAQVLNIDFVEQFGLKLNSLTELLGLERKMPMAAGSVIKTYKSTVTLAGGEVAPGEIIPLSKVEKKPDKSYELAWDKRRKAVPAELIQDVGFDAAVQQTDAKFVREIQKGLRDKLLGQLKTGTGTVTAAGLQATMAQAWGGVTKAFEEDDVTVIGFVSTDDIADYLGTAQVSTQSAFGMSYLENFLNFKVVFAHPSIPKGTLYATAAQNLVLAYAAMSGPLASTFDLTTDETGLIGITHDVNKQRLTCETVAMYGIVLFAENLNGVVKGTIKAAGV